MSNKHDKNKTGTGGAKAEEKALTDQAGSDRSGTEARETTEGKSGLSPTPTSAGSAEGQTGTAPATGSEEPSPPEGGDNGEKGEAFARQRGLEEPGTVEEAGFTPPAPEPGALQEGPGGTEDGLALEEPGTSAHGAETLAEGHPFASPPPVEEPKPDRTVPFPSVGRTVHYVLAGGCNAGQTRAAIITRTHVNGHDTAMEVNLNVFPDRATDYQTNTPEEFTRDTPYDEDGAPGTWRWPARV